MASLLQQHRQQRGSQCIGRRQRAQHGSATQQPLLWALFDAPDGGRGQGVLHAGSGHCVVVCIVLQGEKHETSDVFRYINTHRSMSISCACL